MPIVHSGTAPAAARRYSAIMKPEDLEIAVVLAWALIWSVIAVALASSPSNWVLLVALGVLPPLLILRMWRPPLCTVPARIRDARN